MAKRGSSGLSLVVGVNKPAGRSSHDVVNQCRRIFGERRVGHTGTLDPAATGALTICVGPAARLEKYFVNHTKRYQFRIAFGVATDTEDAEGSIIETAPVPENILDPHEVKAFLQTLRGSQEQIPPIYSAIKVDGRRSYAEARSGRQLDLKARSIEILDCKLLGLGSDAREPLDFHALPDPYCAKHSYVSKKQAGDALLPEKAEIAQPGHQPLAAHELSCDGESSATGSNDAQSTSSQQEGEKSATPSYAGCPYWDVEVLVSKGTYIRSLARDIGKAVGSCAHVAALHRIQSGSLHVDACVDIDQLEQLGSSCALNPVALLGIPLILADEKTLDDVRTGRKLSLKQREFFSYNTKTQELERISFKPEQGDLVAIVGKGALQAIYSYQTDFFGLGPACVFSEGVSCGSAL